MPCGIDVPAQDENSEIVPMAHYEHICNIDASAPENAREHLDRIVRDDVTKRVDDGEVGAVDFRLAKVLPNLRLFEDVGMELAVGAVGGVDGIGALFNRVDEPGRALARAREDDGVLARLDAVQVERVAPKCWRAGVIVAWRGDYCSPVRVGRLARHMGQLGGARAGGSGAG